MKKEFEQGLKLNSNCILLINTLIISKIYRYGGSKTIWFSTEMKNLLKSL